MRSVKTLIVFLAFFFTALGGFAWEEKSDILVTASGNTAVEHPPVLSNDGIPNTYASFKPAESGWLKIKLDEARLVKAVQIDGIVPGGIEGSVGYEQGGMQKTFPSGYFSERSGEFVIDIARSRVVTDTLYISFKGDLLDQIRVNEIRVLTEDADEVYYRKRLLTIEASDNTSYHSSEQSLTDSLPGTYWAVRSPEEWGHLHWFVQECLKGWHKYVRRRAPWKEGFVELAMEEPGSAEKLKIYVKDSASGRLEVSIKKNGGWQSLDTLDLEHISGWLSYDLEPAESIEGLKLYVIGRNKELGGIGEVEIWGREGYKGLVSEDLFACGEGVVNEDSGFFTLEEVSPMDSYTLSAVFNSLSEENILNLNGEDLSPFSIIPQDEAFLYEYRLLGNQLWQGDNFIGLQFPEDSKYHSVHLRKNEDDGILLNTEGLPGDGRVVNGIWGRYDGEVSFDGEYDVHYVKVSFSGSAPGTVYQKNRGVQAQVYSHDNGAVFHGIGDSSYPGGNGDYKILSSVETGEGYVIYRGEGPADTIGFTAGTDVTEVEVTAGRTEASFPFIRILQPESYGEYLEHEFVYKAVYGISDSPEGDFKINGKRAKVYGNIFFVEAMKLNIKKEHGLQSITATVNDSQGRSSSYDVNYLNYSNRYYIRMDQEEDQYYTRDDYFTVSGKANYWVNRLYINDEAVPIDRMNFSSDIPLKEGLNQIQVKFTDRWRGQTVAMYIIKVYKYSGEIAIDIKNPVDGIYVNEAETYVSGSARGAGLSSVTVNGKSTTINGTGFVSDEPVALSSDENIITVTAVDKTGYSTTKTITVYRDLIPPVISEVNPPGGTWFKEKDVTFSGIATDDNSCTVLVNGHLAMRSGDGFLAVVPLEEGDNEIQVIATDLAGNVARHEPFIIKIDSTPPETFDIGLDPDTWTSNRRPDIAFSTTDAGIGLSHYEVSINGQNYVLQQSPFKLPFLPEGENLIQVKAFDYLGNTRIENTYALIDLTPPEDVKYFRAVPGKDSMEVRWLNEDPDAVKFLFTTPEDGVITIHAADGEILDEGEYEYGWKESGLSSGDQREFSISSVDAAGNISDPISITGMVALAESRVEDIEEGEGLVIEFENVFMNLASDALEDDIATIYTQTIESEELEEIADNTIVGPIYSFFAENKDGDIVNHLEFENDFIASIDYDESQVPEGIDEEELAVYYFDTFWGTWFRVENSLVDSELNKIVFFTNHFTDFTVQATEIEDLSPEELSKAEFSNFMGTAGHDPVSVSPQNGSLSTSMTDLYLPGKNGFDFALRRIYGISTAREDSRIGSFKNGSIDITEGEQDKITKKYGRELSFGQGWMLDLPHVKKTNKTVMLAVPGGGYYDLASLSTYLKDPNTSFTDIFKRINLKNTTNIAVSDNDEISTVYENHDGDHFTFVLNRKKVSASQVDDNTPIRNRLQYYAMVSSELHMADGTTYSFDKDGRLLFIEDPTKTMKIVLTYNDVGTIKHIVDSLGRKIVFEYSDDTFPVIKKIYVEGTDRVVEYKHSSIYKNGSLALNLTIPLLSDVIESGNGNSRSWSYEYTDKLLKTEAARTISDNIKHYLKDRFPSDGDELSYSDVAKKITDLGSAVLSALGYTSVGADHLIVVDTLSGPGLGVVDVSYTSERPKAVYYTNGGLFSGKNKHTKKFDEILQVQTLTEKAGDSLPAVTSSYSYDIHGFEKKDDGYYYNRQTTINNGSLRTVYVFDKDMDTGYSYVSIKQPKIDDDSGSDSEGDTYFAIGHQRYRFCVPLNTQISYEIKDSNGSWITAESTYMDYDDEHRVIRERRIKGAGVYSQTKYKYDDWSNYSRIHYSEYSELGSLSQITTNTYKDATDFDPHAHGLISSTVVSNSVNSSLGNTTPSTKKTLYGYNAVNQRDSVKEWLGGNRWAETVYQYYASNHASQGGLKSITSPTGHVTEYRYAYPSGSDYTITTTEKDVKLSDSETKDLKTIAVYDFETGNLVRSTDAENNTVSFEYDAFNRKIKETRPATEGEESPVIDIIYNDSALTTTHADAMGAVTIYSFDLKGQLKNIEKVNGSETVTTILEYDAFGNITKITDPNEHAINYSYDGMNRLTLEDFGNGITRSYGYDDYSNIKTTTLEDKAKIYEASDLSGNVIRRTEVDRGDAAGRTSYALYDADGNITTSIAANGLKKTYFYNTRRLLVREQSSAVPGYDGNAEYEAGSKVEYQYDDSGNRTSETRWIDQNRSVTSSTKPNGMGWVLSESVPFKDFNGTEKTSTVAYEYDRMGRVVTTIDGNGIDRHTVYSPRGQVIEEVDGEGQSVTYKYDLEDRLRFMTDPRESIYGGDFTIEYRYDDLDRLIKGLLPAGFKSEKPEVALTYDPRGNLRFRTEPDDGVTEYTYDFRNRIDSETRTGSRDNGQTVSYRTEYEYDAVGNRTLVRQPDGREWKSFYDGFRNLIQETQPNNTVKKYKYDSMDQLITYTNGIGFRSYYKYDLYGRMIRETDAEGYSTEYSYDLTGNRTRMIDPRGNEWTYRYDEMARMIQESNSRGKKASYVYDEGGRLVSLTDPNKTKVSYLYNRNNQPVDVSYVNDAKSQQESQRESFVYDEGGAVKQASIDGVTSSYNMHNGSYRPDPYGLVTSHKNSFDGVSYITDYAYDVMNRLTEVSYPSTLKVSQSWNNLGQLEEVTGYADDFLYNVNGLMTGYTTANGVVTNYDYDRNNRLSLLQHSKDSEDYVSYSYGYDKEDNMQSKNDDLYGYDPRNQLTVAYLTGLVSESEFEISDDYKDLTLAQGDILAHVQAEQVEEGEVIRLDEGANSLVIDYGYPYRMTKASIIPSSKDHRGSLENLEVYTSMYDNEGYYSKPENVSVSIDEETGAIRIKFEEALFARFIKVHSHFNAMDNTGSSITGIGSFSVDGESSIEAYAMVSGRNEFYNYDEKGNRTEKLLMTDVIEESRYKMYGNSDLLKSVSDGFGYIYDNNGNLIKKSTGYVSTGDNSIELYAPTDPLFQKDSDDYYEYEYDLKNRLRRVFKYNKTTDSLEKTAEYWYNIDGYRIKKVNKTKEVHYVFDFQGKVLEEIDVTNSETISSVFLKSRHLARVSGDETLFYGLDHQGTTVLVTDETGSAVWSAESSPFGDHVMGGIKIREDLKLKYTGKDYDEDTDLYYFNARWYDASTGRFITEDPARDGSNWYVYVSNNPLKWVDPTGMRRVDGDDVDDDPNENDGSGDNEGEPDKPERPERDRDSNNDDGKNKKKTKEEKSKELGARHDPDAPRGINNPPEDVDKILNDMGVGSDVPSPIDRGEELLGTPYGPGYRGQYNGSMKVPENPEKVDCSEFVAYANDSSIYRTGEIGNNPDLEPVDEPQPGDTKVWVATDPKTEKTVGHMAIITGESGRKALLHADDNPSGVRYTSDYLESYYKNKSTYTDVSIEYYRRKKY